jgi:prepilin-type processing-associated H-X9-DG protein
MDENLVGYLLKSLDPDEQHAVEARLEAHPETRSKLEALERVLTPLASDAEDPAPPPGLALAALGRIAEHKCRPLPAAPRPPRSQLGIGGWPRIRSVDVLAAAALLVIVGGMVLPVLMWARQGSERLACQENLRTVWSALANYSAQTDDGAFPMVQASGPRSAAGAFIPILRDAGTLSNTFLVSCPARHAEPTPAYLTVADLQAAYARDSDQFSRLAREAAGGYAYSLGYRDGPTLVGLRASDPGTLPIVADAAEGGNSLNHGGSGQNVLFIDGHVLWCIQRTVGVDRDDIYVNKQNFLSAGQNRADSVLGPGDASPSGPSD